MIQYMPGLRKMYLSCSSLKDTFFSRSISFLIRVLHTCIRAKTLFFFKNGVRLVADFHSLRDRGHLSNDMLTILAHPVETFIFEAKKMANWIENMCYTEFQSTRHIVLIDQICHKFDPIKQSMTLH